MMVDAHERQKGNADKPNGKKGASSTLMLLGGSCNAWKTGCKIVCYQSIVFCMRIAFCSKNGNRGTYNNINEALSLTRLILIAWFHNSSYENNLHSHPLWLDCK